MVGAEVIAIISVSATALGGFLTSLFHSISLSRCSEISCCGCMCKRNVLSEEAYLNESNKPSHNTEPVSPTISSTNVIN
tara:strand:+ start:260 stop:496 length:237 start_codon:yes stop_codon:yes gene_type:complete